MDATFIHTRRVDHVSKEAYYTILGVRKDRSRQVLAIVNFPTESAQAWEEVFDELKKRGLQQVGLVISDGLKAIEDAIWKKFPTAQIQLCSIHLQRNVQKRVKPKDKVRIAEDLKDVFRTGDRHDSSVKGWERWMKFCQKWGRCYPSLQRMAEFSPYLLLAFKALLSLASTYG
ncbi:MAG: hypothetical protein KatS3mg035_2292 [Bacteroidia bacterium]|nr:MAG: hypothetical protein KatS3mg035_2292 [Bacteroidia bacterium]